MSPVRIQLSRKKGWRKPADAIVVARPSRWGNPYTIDLYRDDYPGCTDSELRMMAVCDLVGLVEGRWKKFDDTPTYPSADEIREHLAGHDLACWCPLDQPCHADSLLRLANS